MFNFSCKIGLIIFFLCVCIFCYMVVKHSRANYLNKHTRKRVMWSQLLFTALLFYCDYDNKIIDIAGVDFYLYINVRKSIFTILAYKLLENSK